MPKKKASCTVLSRASFDPYQSAVVEYLRANRSDATLGNVNISGWHNLFVKGRVGTVGSAVPALFLHCLARESDNLDGVLAGLAVAQVTGSTDAGGWSILSVPTAPIVTATAWCIRALQAFGRKEHRSCIIAGEAWIVGQQDATGGWGPRQGHALRLIETSHALLALAQMNAPDAESVAKGVQWVRDSQRPDGSWGPTPNEDGDLSHTAIALVTLDRVGIDVKSDTVQRGLAHLERVWPAKMGSIEREFYEVMNMTGQYNRISLEHDVDALVVSAMAAFNCISLRPEVLAWAGSKLEDFQLRHELFTPGMAKCIWSLIPRAIAMQAIANSLPASKTVSSLSVMGKTLFSTSPTLSAADIFATAGALAWTSILRHFLRVLAILCLPVIAILYYKHILEVKEIWLHICFPIVLLIIDKLASKHA